MSIRSRQMMKKSNDRILFNQPRCHGNSTHFSQNARIKSSVVKLSSCKKRAPKHKWLKSNGELGIGSSKLCSATLISFDVLNFKFNSELAVIASGVSFNSFDRWERS